METAPVPPPIAIPDVTALEDSGGIDEELIVTPGKIITQTFFRSALLTYAILPYIPHVLCAFNYFSDSDH